MHGNQVHPGHLAFYITCTKQDSILYRMVGLYVIREQLCCITFIAAEARIHHFGTITRGTFYTCQLLARVSHYEVINSQVFFCIQEEAAMNLTYPPSNLNDLHSISSYWDYLMNSKTCHHYCALNGPLPNYSPSIMLLVLLSHFRTILLWWYLACVQVCNYVNCI